MPDWPTSVRYVDRLGQPDERGALPAFDVEIPTTRDQAFDWIRTLDRLFEEDPAAWKQEYRRAASCCWFTLNLLLTGGRRLDPFTGRVEADCEFMFNHYREMQFQGNRCLNKSHRGSHKSHIRGYVGVTNRIVINPDLVVAYVAHEKQAAFRHAFRAALEWQNNQELKLAFDDTFYWDPEKESPSWNQDRGWTVKRTIASILPSASAYAILDAPTGGRVGLYMIDDVEDQKTVETDDQRSKLLERFTSFLDVAGRLPEVWANGTSFHSNGLVAHLERSGAWNVICHPAEDVTKPAPDIAALYDACGGRLPDGSMLPKKVRDVRLDGEPTFLHPLELAQKRLDNMLRPGGLANYYRQYQGDALAGLQNRLNPDHLRYYYETPEERARGAVLVMTIDGSRGINDPTVALVWALYPDESISLLDGLRKKIPTHAFGKEMFDLWAKWEGLGRFEQIRVEIFGQATWDYHITNYFERRGKDCPRMVPISSPLNNQHNRKREFDALDPLLRTGRTFFPKQGIEVEDEEEYRYDLVEYAVENELRPFPTLDRDDFVASWALLGVRPDTNVTGQKKIQVGPLPFPEDFLAMELRERTRGLMAARARESQDWSDSVWWEN